MLEGSPELDPHDELRLTQQALSQLRESVIITDAQIEEPGPHIVYVNAAFTRMTGWLPEEVVGRNPRLLQGPKTTRKTLDRLRSKMETGESFTGEDINYRKDGSEFYIDWYIEPLRNAQGEISYFVAVQRDVTERKELEAQVLQAQRLEGIGMLASGIAHDLNNVLAPILIAPQIIREQAKNPELEEILALVEQSAQRGVSLVKQVLVFARGTNDPAGFVQPRHVIDELGKMAQKTFPKSITISTDAFAETWLVETDATQLYQLLLNLCVNARDAIGGAGAIKVSARNLNIHAPLKLTREELPLGKYVVLSVADNGSGIAAEHLDKLFKPFFTTKAEGKGTGLGLATVAMVVKNSRGAIDIQTEIGKGTTFSIYLPAAQAPATVQDSSNSIQRASTPRSILLVDDETAVMGVMREVLRSAGHTVTTAESGAEARALTSRMRFDLALVDLMMPGEEAGAAIHEMHAKGLPIIAMSGMGAATLTTSVPANTAILQKPFTFTALLQVVEGVACA